MLKGGVRKMNQGKKYAKLRDGEVQIREDQFTNCHNLSPSVENSERLVFHNETKGQKEMPNDQFMSLAPQGKTRKTTGVKGQEVWTIGSFAEVANEVDEERAKKLFGGLYGGAVLVLEEFTKSPDEALTIQQIQTRNSQYTESIEEGIWVLMKRGILGQTTPIKALFGLTPYPSSGGSFCLTEDSVRMLKGES